jgi:hypothetical protein
MSDEWDWAEARARALAALDQITAEDALQIVRQVLTGFNGEVETRIAPALVGAVIGMAQRHEDAERRHRERAWDEEREGYLKMTSGEEYP